MRCIILYLGFHFLLYFVSVALLVPKTKELALFSAKNCCLCRFGPALSQAQLAPCSPWAVFVVVLRETYFTRYKCMECPVLLMRLKTLDIDCLIFSEVFTAIHLCEHDCSSTLLLQRTQLNLNPCTLTLNFKFFLNVSKLLSELISRQSRTLWQRSVLDEVGGFGQH